MTTFTKEKYKTLTKLVRNRFRLEYKGGSTVVISESRMNEESRSHVEIDKAYEKASNFAELLGKKLEGLRKYPGVILDDKQKE
jgi:hypothetical protein